MSQTTEKPVASWFSYEEIKALQNQGVVRAPEYVVGAIDAAREGA